MQLSAHKVILLTASSQLKVKKLNKIDNMAKTIEMINVDSVVRDSELEKHNDVPRGFEYNLDEKAAKGKLIKGAKRASFEIVRNSSSCNLIFNLGSWNNVVLPSIRYWSDINGFMSCTIGKTIVI